MSDDIWPHGPIVKVFDSVYMVTGTNITHYDGTTIQHSRNMVIIKNNQRLTLVNSVRLSDSTLEDLKGLGEIDHVIRLGAFHGRDDEFYLDRYKATFWGHEDIEFPGLQGVECNYLPSRLDFINAEHIIFQRASPKEGVLYLQHDGGIMITCDSIKNWTEVDQYFSEETGKSYLEAGEIATARISPIWLNATGVKASDFDSMLAKPFKHLISAHGEVLRDNANRIVKERVSRL